MATEPGPADCPVCAEPLLRGTERCFRCESDLRPWWPFEEKLASAPAPVAPTIAATRPEPSRPLVGIAAVLAAGVAGLALGISLRRGGDAPPATVPATVASVETPATRGRAEVPAPPPTTLPAEFEDRSVKLVVQEGDSLWRLAKTLTGRGDSWRALWPDMSEAQARDLVPGTVLTVRLSRAGQDGLRLPDLGPRP